MRDFLAYLAVRRRVAASTQNQALCAVLFLCREVLGVDVDGLGDTVRARSGSRLPVVLSVPEVVSLLGAMRGTSWLQAALIYGGGLRVTECCRLRVKDIDFDQADRLNQLTRPASYQANNGSESKDPLRMDAESL